MLFEKHPKTVPFTCFSVAKSSKSHPTDSDVGVRTSESGVGRLRGFASKPSPPLTLSAVPPLSRHRNQVGNQPCGGKRERIRRRDHINYLHCRRWRHNQSALSFEAEEEGATRGAAVTGWRIGLILRAPGSAAGRILPRRTTCGGFWYFWPQKYKEKRGCKHLFLPKLFCVFRKNAGKTFPFNCFSMAKSSKSHPTDSDGGVRSSESGVGRLRGFASKPSPPLTLSAARPLFRHRNQVGTLSYPTNSLPPAQPCNLYSHLTQKPIVFLVR